MAKAKSSPKAKSREKPKVKGALAAKVEPERSRPANVHIRATQEWRAWLERAAAYSRMSVSVFLDVAAKKLAKANGFEEPPPER